MLPDAVNPLPPDVADTIFNSSSERMDELPDRSVHLMITSPPYNVGMDYEESLSQEDHIELVEDVLAETYRVLVAGGRACVNAAGIGRNPYYPLHADVSEAARRVGFSMRGEIVWHKGYGGQMSSTAWGSWMSPSNPTLRDAHEYIFVFQKLPFGRPKQPGDIATITRDEFLEYTKSIWEIQSESAKRVGHPAPFPVELPRRLIQLYTFKDEVVLDPFMGSGSTALAAIATDRRFVGYELQRDYIRLAERRIFEATAQETGGTRCPRGLTSTLRMRP